MLVNDEGGASDDGAAGRVVVDRGETGRLGDVCTGKRDQPGS